MRTRWVNVAAVLAVLMALPTWGIARSLGEFMHSDVDWTYAGDFNLHVGQMYLDDSDWSPVEDQLRFGAEIDFTNSRHWAGTVIGFSLANEDQSASSGPTRVTIQSEFLEVYVGIRKVFYNFSYVRPFAGLGGALHSVDIERKGVDTSDSDSALGYGGYVELGLYVDLYGPFHLGGSLRYDAGSVDLFGSNKNPGGLTLGAMIGTHWLDF